jgi:hypothetical protein
MEKGRPEGKIADILRNVVLSSLLVYKREFGKKYGDIVIAVDGRNNWRRDIFPQYKAKRAEGRAESDMNWDAIFKFMREFQEDLVNVFPWRVVQANRAEADDVIASLVLYLQDADVCQEGLFETSADLLIVSSDGDFGQLHKFSNVSQYSPMGKKMLPRQGKDFLIEKVIRGDGGDGVPTILEADDFFVKETRTRAKAITQKVIDRIKSGQMSEDEKKHLTRNLRMIDFNFIPEAIITDIVEIYRSQTPKKDLNGIMEYLMKHQCRNLLSNVHAFQ